MKRTPLMVTGLVIIIVGGLLAWNLARTAPDEAPGFTLTSTGYEQGNSTEPVTFSLSDYEGQTVLLDFMAVNCSACRVLTDQVVRPLYEEYGNRSDVAFLSIDVWAGSSGETNEELIRLQEDERAPWRHALDTDRVLERYGAYNIPMLVVVDGTGQIIYSETGIPAKSTVEKAMQDGIAGVGESQEIVAVGLVGLAFVAGAASIFSPCCIGLLPSYMGYLVSHGSRLHEDEVRGTLRAGAATALGIASIYVVLAVLLWLYAPLFRPHVAKVAPAIGVAMIVLGAAMLFGWSWTWLTSRFSASMDGRRGFFAFGLGYGVASFGCTGPVFLPLLLAGFLASAWLGFTVLLAYTAAVALLVFLAAYLTATGQATVLKGINRYTQPIQKISAALMIGAGVYLVAFYWQAYGGFA